MSRRGVSFAALIVAAVAVFSSVTIALTGTNDDGATEAAETGGLTTRTVKAGEVTVKIDPRQLGANGAMFDIAFDTHSGDLSFDATRVARLEVAGTAWKVAEWRGDGPGGHHREGVLRFTAGGPATGTARLTIDGLAGPVEATWELGS